MADPITVGGGGGLVNTQAADYDVTIEFNDLELISDTHGNYAREGYKISTLDIREVGGLVPLLDFTPLLSADGICEIILKFNHERERIYIRSSPIRISFKDDLWPKEQGKRKRQTQGDKIIIEFLQGKWNSVELKSPPPNLQLRVMSEPI